MVPSTEKWPGARQVSRNGLTVHRARRISAGDHFSNVFTLLAVSVCAVGWARLGAQCGRALHRPTPPPRSPCRAVRITLRPISCWDGGAINLYNNPGLRTPYYHPTASDGFKKKNIWGEKRQQFVQFLNWIWFICA